MAVAPLAPMSTVLNVCGGVATMQACRTCTALDRYGHASRTGGIACSLLRSLHSALEAAGGRTLAAAGRAPVLP